MKKLLYAATLMVLTAALLSACGTGDVSESSESLASEGVSLNEKALTQAELITDENRSLIGTVITNPETPEVVVLEEQQSNGNEPENTYMVPENDVITAISADAVLPATISVFIATEGTTPEVIAPNGSCAVFVPTPNETGWDCHEGESLIFNFEKYEVDDNTTQAMTVGYVFNGVMMAGENQNSLRGSYKVDVKEDGYYAIYFIGATSDYLALRNGQISIVKANTESSSEE